MNISVSFREVESLDALSSLRDQYLDALLHPQDALLETFVVAGRPFVIEHRGEAIGYFVTHGEGLVEFFVTRPHEAQAQILFPRIVAERGLAFALVKTFDALFLACALDLQTEVVVRGVLARDYLPRELPVIPRIRYTRRTARLEDLPRIAAVEQDVFTHQERLRRVVEHGEMQLFEKDDALVGFGIVRPVIANRPDVELGIAVDTPYRNKGYAVYMLREMVDHCLSRGLNPISGCARSNEASVRLGVRIGYSGRYRLLEIRFRQLNQPK